MLDESQVELLDLERQSGSAWLGASKIACATAPLADEDPDFFVFRERDQRPWINVKAAELKTDRESVLQAISRAQR